MEDNSVNDIDDRRRVEPEADVSPADLMRAITSLASSVESLDRRVNAITGNPPPQAPAGTPSGTQPTAGRNFMMYTWDIRGNRITLDHAGPHQLAAARQYVAPATTQPLRSDHGPHFIDGNASRVPDLSGLFAPNLLFWIEAHPYACIDLSLVLPEKMAQAQVLLMAAQFQPGPTLTDQQAGSDPATAGEIRSAAARRAAALFERAGLDPSLRAKVDSAGDATSGGFASLETIGSLTQTQFMSAMLRYTSAIRKAVSPPDLAEALAARLFNHCNATMSLIGTHSSAVWNGYDRSIRSTWGALGAALAPNHNQGCRDELVLQAVVLQLSQTQPSSRARAISSTTIPQQRKRGPTADRTVAPEKDPKTPKASPAKREHPCRQWNSSTGCSYGSKCKFTHSCSKCGKEDHIATACEE